LNSVTVFIVVYLKVDPSDVDNCPKMIELWFMFSMIWSVCCSVDEDGRKKIDAYLREVDGTFPNKDSIYEYYVEPKTRSWIHWEEKLKQGWKLNPRFNVIYWLAAICSSACVLYCMKL